MFVRKVSSAALAAILGLALPTMVFAKAESSSGPLALTMDAGVEAWAGDVTYSIGYPATDAWGYTYYGYFPFSELTFPLDDVVYGSVSAQLDIIDQYFIGIELKKNVTDPDDNMEDRDWITDSNPTQLDIYSDSEVIDFSALVVDIDAGFRFYEDDKFSLAAVVGYKYQEFEWDTALIHQWSPSGMEGWEFWGDGTSSIIYEVDIEMPYLAIDGSFNIMPNLRVNGRFAYAPWVDVDDQDQHLLRDKVNIGDLDGTAAMLSLGVEFDITPALFINGGLEHTTIEAEGDMEAFFYGVYDHTVTEELESNQTAAFVTIGYRLGL